MDLAAWFVVSVMILVETRLAMLGVGSLGESAGKAWARGSRGAFDRDGLDFLVTGSIIAPPPRHHPAKRKGEGKGKGSLGAWKALGGHQDRP